MDNNPIPQYLFADAVHDLKQDCQIGGFGGHAESKEVDVDMYVEIFSVDPVETRERSVCHG